MSDVEVARLLFDIDEIIKQQKKHTVAIVELQTLVKNGLTGKVNKIDNRMWALMILAIATLLSVAVPLLV